MFDSGAGADKMTLTADLMKKPLLLLPFGRQWMTVELHTPTTTFPEAR